MPTFDELIEQLRNPGDAGLPDTIYDDLSRTYGDMASQHEQKLVEMEATNATGVATLEGQLAERDSEISRLKAALHEARTSGGSDGGGDDDADENNSDDGAPAGIDALFEKKD